MKWSLLLRWKYILVHVPIQVWVKWGFLTGIAGTYVSMCKSATVTQSTIPSPWRVPRLGNETPAGATPGLSCGAYLWVVGTDPVIIRHHVWLPFCLTSKPPWIEALPFYHHLPSLCFPHPHQAFLTDLRLTVERHTGNNFTASWIVQASQSYISREMSMS